MLFFSGQEGCALLQLFWWFSLFQNSVIPTGLAWEDMLYPLYQKYKNVITWGDQDLLNIIFYFNPGRLIFQNVICVGLCSPHPSKHIPARSAIEEAWPVLVFPNLVLGGTTFHACLGSHGGGSLCFWCKMPNDETSNTGLHFGGICSRFCQRYISKKHSQN